MPKPDFVGDESQSYLFLLKEAGALPDYVEAVPEAKDLEGLPNVAFANSDDRLYPVHDKQSAFLSAVTAFVQGANHDEDPWLSKLKTACHAYHIDADVVKAHEVLEVKTARDENLADVEEIDKTASARPTHALELVVTPDQAPQKFYPIGSASQIEESARKMASDIRDKKLPMAWHSEACELLMKAASDFGIPENKLPGSVVRYGRRFVPSREVLDSEIEKRASLGLGADYIEIYKQAAESALGGGISATDGALIWQTADKKAGIDSQFSGDEDPLWAFKSGAPAEEVEQLKEAHCMLGNVLIHRSALEKVADEEMVKWLDIEDARQAVHAKKASTGTQATELLGGMTERGVTRLSELVLKAND